MSTEKTGRVIEKLKRAYARRWTKMILQLNGISRRSGIHGEQIQSTRAVQVRWKIDSKIVVVGHLLFYANTLCAARNTRIVMCIANSIMCIPHTAHGNDDNVEGDDDRASIYICNSNTTSWFSFCFSFTDVVHVISYPDIICLTTNQIHIINSTILC